MYCFKCGKEISSDMLYCPYCGSKTINENNKTDKKKDTDTKIKVSKQNTGLVIEQEKTQKIDIDFKNVFKNIGFFIYNARKVIFSILYTTLILLFFCNFLKLNMFGVEITKVNGFTAIKYLFNGDFFDNIANNNLDLSSVKTLIQIAYFIYFVLLAFLVESLIANIVALIKKENSVNKLNFANSISIFFASILITILYFVIKKDLIDLYGNLFTYSSGVLAIAIVSIIPLVISIWCRFSKNNNEKYKSLDEIKASFKNFFNKTKAIFLQYHWCILIVEFVLLILLGFGTIASKNADTLLETTSIFSLSDYMKGVKVFYVISVCLIVLNLLFFLFLKQEKPLHIQNVFTQITILASSFTLFYELKFEKFNLSAVAYIISIICALSIILSTIYIRLYNKQINAPKLHFNDLIRINKGLFIETLLLLASPIIAYILMPLELTNMLLTIALLSGIFILINLIHGVIVEISSETPKKEILLCDVIKHNEKYPNRKRSEVPLVIFSIFIAFVLISTFCLYMPAI